MKQLTILNRIKFCLELLTIRSVHRHPSFEKQLSTFARGYEAGYADRILEEMEEAK